MGLSSKGKLFGAVRVGLPLNSSVAFMQPQAKSLGHLEHGCETWIALGAEGAIQALAAEAGIPGSLRQPLGTGDVTQGPRQSSHIIRCLLKPGIQLVSHFFWCTQMLGHVIRRESSGSRSAHGLGLGHGVWSSKVAWVAMDQAIHTHQDASPAWLVGCQEASWREPLGAPAPCAR